MDATTAALEVGYASPSQFSREYRWLFGLPPLQDIKAVQNSSAAGAFEKSLAGPSRIPGRFGGFSGPSDALGPDRSGRGSSGLRRCRCPCPSEKRTPDLPIPVSPPAIAPRVGRPDFRTHPTRALGPRPAGETLRRPKPRLRAKALRRAALRLKPAGRWASSARTLVSRLAALRMRAATWRPPF